MVTEFQEYLNDSLDQVYSTDPATVNDGLQRLDALLGELCVKNLKRYNINIRNTRHHNNRRKNWRVPNEDDELFGEFIQLQKTFDLNICNAMVYCLSQFNLKTNNRNNIYPQEFIVLVNRILQGVLLLHPPSRMIFYRDCNMKLLISYLIYFKYYDPVVTCSIIQTIVCVLVRSVKNIRQFERFNGIKIICELFNQRKTRKEIKLKILEFLFFYLIPESNSDYQNDGKGSDCNIKYQGDQLVNLDNHVITSQSKTHYKDGISRRSMSEKADYLRRYLLNVDDLVEEMLTSKPFGEMQTEW